MPRFASPPIAFAVALVAFGATLAWSGDAMARAHKHRRRGGGFKPARAVVVVPPPPRISVPDATPAPQVATLPPRAPASSMFGRVQFATEHRAYLDRGSAEGLLVGQWLASPPGGGRLRARQTRAGG